MGMPLFNKVDAVLVKVPSIEEGLAFYCEKLGHELRWRKDDQAAVKLGDCELVMSTTLDPETDILVDSVQDAVKVIQEAGGKIIVQPEDIRVGKMAVIQDPFGNTLTLVDLSKGIYQTDEKGQITGVE